MRRVVLAALIVLATLVQGVAAVRAADGAAPTAPVVRRISPVQYVPSPAREARAAVWDTLHRLERAVRWAVSESLATALIAELQSRQRVDSLALSRAYLYIANSRLARRLHADGRGVAMLEQAVGIRERHDLPHDSLVIWAHVKAATMFSEAGHPRRAVAHGEAGLRMLAAIAPADTSMLAQAHLGLATALVAVGRDAEAGPHFETALWLRERADDGMSRLLVPILADYGVYLSRQGELDRARAMLRRAVEVAERDGSAGGDFIANSLSRLSSFESRVGNLAESVELAWRAYEASRRMNASGVPTLRARTTLAYRLQEFGDLQGSVVHLREVLPGLAAGLGAAHPQTTNARLALAWGLVSIGDTAAAAHELAEARAALARQDLSTNNNQVYAMQVGANLDGLAGRHAAARETLAAAAMLEWTRHDPFGGRQAGLLAHYYDRIRDPQDREHVAAAAPWVARLVDSTHVGVTPEWIILLRSRAAAEARVGLRASAWPHALEAEARARERLAYQIGALSDLRGLQLADQLGRPCELLAALVPPDDPATIATAWDRIVRWRGMVRHEIARRRAPEVASRDTAVAGAHARWIEAQRAFAQLVVSGAAHAADSAAALLHERARQQAENAERALARASRGLVGADSEATLDRVLQALRPDQALAAFAVASTGAGDPVLGAFVASGRERRPRWIALGPVPDLERDARAWITALATPPTEAARAEERACRRLGTVVRERVWDPIRRAAGDASELILVPEGVTTELAWLALPDASGHYLADGMVGVRILGAERDLIGGAGVAEGKGLLAAGGPDFSGAGGPVAASLPAARLRAPAALCATGGALALSDLPAARAEAERIAQAWPAASGPARLLVGAEATEAAWKAEAPGKAVIHVATHGLMIDDSCRAMSPPGARGIGGVAALAPSKATKRKPSPAPPSPAPATSPWLGRQVWLALAGANHAAAGVDENEGLLTAEEIVTLDLRGVDWVVLSACHSGASGAWTREGALGMRRAFQLAGARAVIASQWAVGDRSAAEWMEALYAARAPGASAGRVAGEASRRVLATRRADRRSTHPFHWAAFSAWGD